MSKEENYINRCIELAKKGAGMVSPNPLAGCVLVKGNKIIGEGYHKKSGGPHAEINAIRNAERSGYSTEGADLYINLEPCCHYGKTPPCTEAIISKKIRKVIIGISDPNPLVNGRGIRELKKAGIEVTTGIKEEECRELNRFFIKHITEKRPYITLKIAQSLDGFIALENFKSKWITNSKSRGLVYLLRAEYDAVLIGRNTALRDNPLLTSHKKGRNPKRIIIDRKNDLPKSLNIFKNTKDTIIITSKLSNEYDKGSQLILKDKKCYLIRDILSELYRRNISSILVEGGASIFSQFTESNLFDEIYFFIAPIILGEGIAPFRDYKTNEIKDRFGLKAAELRNTDNDIMIRYRRNK